MFNKKGCFHSFKWMKSNFTASFPPGKIPFSPLKKNHSNAHARNKVIANKHIDACVCFV